MRSEYIDGFVQDCSNSIANALELQQSCTKPSIYIMQQSENMSTGSYGKNKLGSQPTIAQPDNVIIVYMNYIWYSTRCSAIIIASISS